MRTYPRSLPLLFDVTADPQEAFPLCRGTVADNITSCSEYASVLKAISAAYDAEGEIYRRQAPEPDRPGEGKGKYGICCDEVKGCDCDGPPIARGSSVRIRVGT